MRGSCHTLNNVLFFSLWIAGGYYFVGVFSHSRLGRHLGLSWLKGQHFRTKLLDLLLLLIVFAAGFMAAWLAEAITQYVCAR